MFSSLVVAGEASYNDSTVEAFRRVVLEGKEVQRHFGFVYIDSEKQRGFLEVFGEQ